ncbi:GYDIA family GHMP kinase [Sediminicola sp. 1XM1-17]|uniref:GYDIA family GHMP kinase n=1 Tax=Sediminicola sp. 1XM1-17 TaxID=3127702 RepID=UPI00307847A0
MEDIYYSHGKLLITGEYAVLDGALSLALPTTYGQSLKISPIEGSSIIWRSYTNTKEIWFETSFEPAEIKKKHTHNKTESSVRNTLIKILSEAFLLNPNFLKESSGLLVETQLDFPRDWGLGSSSTLINNIAQWAEVDAYKLLWLAFSGSGYDIACAQHKTAITYQIKEGRPMVKEVDFDPDFKDQLYFVHLNQKQNSREGIAQYRKMEFNTDKLISDIGLITKKLLTCQDLAEFNILIHEHEKRISNILKMETVKSRLFPEFPGSIKSLGAWGGDFILATGREESQSFFLDKGYKTIIPFSDMAL